MVFPYMEVVVGYMILMYLLKMYMHLRQHAALKLPTLPKHLQGVISEEQFVKGRAYELDKINFKFFHEVVEVLMNTTLLLCGLLPWFWKKSGDFVVYVGLNAENEVIHSLAFITVAMICSEMIDLPFSLYSTFVIQPRHGFHQQKVMIFLRDILIGIVLTLLPCPPIVVGVRFIEQKGGPYWAIYMCAFIVAQPIVATMLDPLLISPLFNKFTPLPDGELRAKIENLASSLKFSLKKLLLVNGSARSRHSNAYVYGIFKSVRLVLYDTLIQLFKIEEVVAVVAHELGHWKLNHTVYSFIAAQVINILQFGVYTLVKNSKDIFQSFGFIETQPVLIGFIIFQHVAIPIHHLNRLGFNLVQRSFEFQADAFAKKLGYSSALRATLIKMVGASTMFVVNTDVWYSVYYDSHPPLDARLAALDESNKKED